jgi:hypothetical protein
VSAVTLAVALSKPDADAELRVWTAGTEEPLEPDLLVPRKADAWVTVTVPVGPEGLVSLAPSGGMGHLIVDVVGYTPGSVLPAL